MDTEKTIEEIKKSIKSNKLVISRVPLKTRARFIELASEDEFCQDYGFVLKHLIDFYDGLILSGIEHLEEEVVQLKQEVNDLKLGMEQKDEKKTLSGSRIGGTEK